MYEKRIEKVKKLLAERGIEVAFVTKDENKFYLSGFRSSNFYIILTPEKNYLLTDFRYMEKARRSGGPFEFVKLKDQPNSIFDFLKENFTGKIIGIEEDHLTYAFYQTLRQYMEDQKLTSQQEVIEKARSIKDQDELDNIIKAAAIADGAFEHILKFIKPGLTELEVALELEFYMRTHGAEKLSFDSIVVSGENSALPHGEPGGRKLSGGDMITMDFGCVVNGYCSDMTRTVALGSATAEMQKVYHTVKKAQREASLTVKAKMAGKDVDQIARDIITTEGYGESFGHGLGHGVGLEIHESPALNRRSGDILAENMVVTVEPGIYLPGKFGVRIEDLAIVKNDGIINLCKSSKELIVI